MATNIQLGRQTSANMLVTLQNDDGLWAMAQELQPYLKTLPLSRVTSQGLLAFVKTLHDDAALSTGGVIYEWQWDPVEGRWIKICWVTATISLDAPTGGERVLIAIEESARYN